MAFQDMSIEVLAVSFINVFIIYMAAFSYQLDWSGVVAVIVIASLLTASINLLGSLAIFLILVFRFDLLTAIGVTLLSGLILSVIHALLA
jgi:hypothetical protein